MAAFSLPQQSWLVATGTIWLTEPEIFPVWPSTDSLPFPPEQQAAEPGTCFPESASLPAGEYGILELLPVYFHLILIFYYF